MRERGVRGLFFLSRTFILPQFCEKQQISSIKVFWAHARFKPWWREGSFLMWVHLCGQEQLTRLIVFLIIRQGIWCLKVPPGLWNEVRDERRMFSFNLLLLTSSYHSPLAIENKTTLRFHRTLNKRKRNKITQIATNRYAHRSCLSICPIPEPHHSRHLKATIELGQIWQYAWG